MKKLKPIGNGYYFVTQEKVDSFKNEKEVAEWLALVANHYCLDIDDTYAWGLAEQCGLTKFHFYNDVFELQAKYGEEWSKYGIVNWKIQKEMFK